MNETTALILGLILGGSMMGSVALHHWFLQRERLREAKERAAQSVTSDLTPN